MLKEICLSAGSILYIMLLEHVVDQTALSLKAQNATSNAQHRLLEMLIPMFSTGTHNKRCLT